MSKIKILNTSKIDYADWWDMVFYLIPSISVVKLNGKFGMFLEFLIWSIYIGRHFEKK